jgi:hypothetical protein
MRVGVWFFCLTKWQTTTWYGIKKEEDAYVDSHHGWVWQRKRQKGGVVILESYMIFVEKIVQWLHSQIKWIGFCFEIYVITTLFFFFFCLGINLIFHTEFLDPYITSLSLFSCRFLNTYILLFVYKYVYEKTSTGDVFKLANILKLLQYIYKKIISTISKLC